MLLVIHNLPTKIRYSEVKGLIKDRCNVVDLILDNLVYDTPQSRKVTVGLSDEGDAALVLKELNGYVYMGQKLFVKDIRKNKTDKAPQSSYDPGNGNQNNEQNNICLTQQTPPVMQNISASSFSMPTNNPYGYQYNMPYTQVMDSQYQPGVPPNNIIPVQTVATYGSNMGMTQSSNMPYSGPSNYTSYQPSMVPHPSETQTNFIPFINKKPLAEYGIKNQGGARYFKKNEQRPSDKVQGFNENSRGSSGRGDQISPARNDRGFNESRNRSSNSDERRYDGWNRSDEFSGRSGGSNNRPGEDKFSDRNQMQSIESHSQSYNKNYRQIPDGNKYDYKDKTDYGDYNKDSNPRRPDERYRPNSMQTDKQTDNNYSRFNDRSYGNAGNSRFDSNKPQRNYDYKRPNFGGSMDKNPSDANRKTDDFQRREPITYPIHNISNKFNKNRGLGFQESRNLTNVPTIPGKYQKPTTNTHNFNQAKKNNPGAITVKDETWRSQAVAAVVKNLLVAHQMENLKHKPAFMPYIKSLVRARMDNMLGKRVSVTLDQILEEYENIYPSGTQKSFLTDAMNKYKFTNVTKKDFKPQGNDAPVQAGPLKRKIPETFQPKLGNIKKFKKKQEQQSTTPSQEATTQLTQYQISKSNKKAFQQLKKLSREEFDGDVVYKLEPKIQQALEEEVKILVDLFNEECQKNSGGEEARVCQRIMKQSENFKKVVTLDVTKRILNITCNLLVRVYSHPRMKLRELMPLVKELGIANMRSSARSKFFIAMCDSYQSFDHLCCTENIKMDGYSLSFKPMHVAGPKPKRKKLGKNNKNGDDGEDTGDDDDFDEEEGGADDEEYGDEDDDDGREEDSDDEHNEDKEDAMETEENEKDTTTIQDTSIDPLVDENSSMTTGVKEGTSVKTVGSEKCDDNNTARSTNNDEEISGIKNEDISETKDKEISETKDQEISETKNEEMSEMKDEEISKTKDTEILETKDEEILETKDEEILETKDEEISETKDESNKECVNNSEVSNTGIENEPIDVANIAQDDLEDF